MSAHNSGSGPRSNSYSENRLTNWSEYEPWWLEVQAVFKRFDGRIAKNPKFPKVIELDPMEGFVRPCTARQVETKLEQCPAEFLKDLRAVFILSGTKKQLISSKRSNRFVGYYWRCCIFLHPYPFALRPNLDWLRPFYVDDVLIHELGHHVDLTNKTKNDQERFAEQFVRKHG
jgi:hypothetical protein